jgi:hypothetical protein
LQGLQREARRGGSFWRSFENTIHKLLYGL